MAGRQPSAMQWGGSGILALVPGTLDGIRDIVEARDSPFVQQRPLSLITTPNCIHELVDPQPSKDRSIVETRRIQIPKGLLSVGSRQDVKDYIEARSVYETFLSIAGHPNLPNSLEYVVNSGPKAGVEWGRDPEDWSTLRSTRGDSVRIGLMCTMKIGHDMGDDELVDRTSLAESADGILVYTWGDEESNSLILRFYVPPGQEAPANTAEAADNTGIQDQLSTYLGIHFHLDYSVETVGIFRDADNQTALDRDHSVDDEVFYIPELSPYTLAMMAALNYISVADREVETVALADADDEYITTDKHNTTEEE